MRRGKACWLPLRETARACLGHDDQQPYQMCIPFSPAHRMFIYMQSDYLNVYVSFINKAFLWRRSSNKRLHATTRGLKPVGQWVFNWFHPSTGGFLYRLDSLIAVVVFLVPCDRRQVEDCDGVFVKGVILCVMEVGAWIRPAEWRSYVIGIHQVFPCPRNDAHSLGTCCFLEEAMKCNVPEIVGLFCMCQSGFVDLEKLLILPQSCCFCHHDWNNTITELQWRVSSC